MPAQWPRLVRLVVISRRQSGGVSFLILLLIVFKLWSVGVGFIPRHASKKCAIHGGGGGGGGVCTGLLSWGLLIEITHASIRRDHLKFGSNVVGAGKAVTVYG